jgi:cytochrome c oxidase subunit II
MTTLLVLASVALLIVVAVQIGRVSELSAEIRGEEAAVEASNRFNARFGLFFMVAFLAFTILSALYYKNHLLGYGLKLASEHGPKIMTLFNWTLFFTGIVFVLTHIALFWYAFKYKEQKSRKVLFIPHDNRLEVIWTAIPAVVMCGLVIGGLSVWNYAMADIAEGEEHIEIEATGYQFAWALRYGGADGALGTKYFKNITPGLNELGVDFNDEKSQDDIISDAASEEIVLPKGKKIRVRITAKDVLHNFYLPHFTVKMDAIPGLPTYFVFTPTMTTEEYRLSLKNNPEFQAPADPAEPNGPKKWETFKFELACAELCGKGHFSMRRVVKIVSPEEYERWKAGLKPFFTENIKGKVDPGKYSWYKGTAQAAPTAPALFSADAISNAETGVTLNLKNVNFATGKSVLTPESSKELNLVADALNKNPKMTIELSGHTDNLGDAVKNKTLSEARAQAVVAYLLSKGIDAARLKSVGFGDVKPISDNTTKEGQAANRRTEVKVLSK